MVLCQLKDLDKETELHTLGHSRDVICPLKVERQQRTTVIDRWYKNKIKTQKTRSSEYLSTKIWRKKWSPKMSYE